MWGGRWELEGRFWVVWGDFGIGWIVECFFLCFLLEEYVFYLEGLINIEK